MRVFLRQLFWFLLPLLAASFAMDVFISRNLTKTNDYFGDFEVWSEIYHGDVDCEVALYGSSRSEVNINPRILERELKRSVYNFGRVAHTFRLQYFQHQVLAAQNVRPRVIILTLDTFSFEDRKSIFNSNQFMPYMLFNEHMRKAFSYSDSFSITDFYVPSVRYRGKRELMTEALRHTTKSRDEMLRKKDRGFMSMPDWNEDVDAKMNRNPYAETFHLPNVELFNKFVDECKASGTKLILLYPPEYVDHHPVITNRAFVFDFFNRLAREHDLAFLDYSNDEICRNKDFFFDGLHLNARGADAFSSKLAADIGEILSR